MTSNMFQPVFERSSMIEIGSRFPLSPRNPRTLSLSPNLPRSLETINRQLRGLKSYAVRGAHGPRDECARTKF